MKKKLFIFICLLIGILFITSCDLKIVENNQEKTSSTIFEQLERLDRIQDVELIAESENFAYVFSCYFEQYIDHDNKALGTFKQKIEFGFNDFSKPNVLVTSGYYISDGNYEYWWNENEIAFIMHGNYVFVEHRYFGESLPVEIDYYDVNCWDYLTTAQAAADLHDIYLEFSKILDGKWAAAGISKGGITTELYAYYYPGDMAVYVPYSGSLNRSNHVTNWVKFINEEIGDIYYGEEVASSMRKTILDIQVKLFEYKEVLAPRFYQDALDNGVIPMEALTEELAYDMAVADFAFVFWQYYQSYYDYLLELLNMPEETEEEIIDKQDEFYYWFSGFTSINYGTNDSILPYYIQALSELGSTGYDFSYIRAALDNPELITITEEEEHNIFINVMTNNGELDFIKDGLMYDAILEMLKTTDDNFIIIYGTSDPFYAERIDDVLDRDNIWICLDYVNAHMSMIQSLDEELSERVIARLKLLLEYQE